MSRLPGVLSCFLLFVVAVDAQEIDKLESTNFMSANS